jgi:hypothetical protein
MKTEAEVDKKSQKRIFEFSDEELIRVAFIESPKYRKEFVDLAKSEVKKRGLPEILVKHCPNCERPVPPEQEICIYGYNFEKPNTELIERVKSRRFRKNQINGLVMVIIGIISYLYFLLSADVSKIGNHSMDKFIYGIPGLLIIFGVYKIFSGKTLKNPTKSPFDSILGDNANQRDESDELPYIFCPRCRKQLLIELKYKHCPNCGYNLK